MLTEARHSMIRNYVDRHGLCRIAELCELTSTSESTIRRDLIQMEDSGVIKRIHGGAQSIQKFSQDISQRVRFSINHDAKVAVAKYVAEYFVHPGDNIFIDAGTTTYEMIPFLAAVPDLMIVTNGVETALNGLNHGLKMILIGGTVKTDTHAVVGQVAIDQLREMNFNSCFVGVNGIDQAGSLTTPDTEEAAIKRAEIMQSKHAYVLADASKFGQRSFAAFADARNVVVISNQLNSSQKKALPAMIKLEEVKG